MVTATATLLLQAPKDDVFDYLSRIESVPEWATEFVGDFQVCSSTEARARTEWGEVTFRLRSDAETGVIDIFVGPDGDRMTLFPTRVVALGRDRSAFIFTMFRRSEQTEERFRAEYESLRRELEKVERTFSTARREFS